MTRQVRDLLDELLDGIRDALGGTFEGAYLFGSCVAGDFDPERSDLDLLVTLSADVDDAQLGALRAAHEAFVATHPEWDDRIDAAYLSTQALRDFAEHESPLVVISRGEPLHATRTSPGWVMNWHLVREHGVALAGPPPRAVIAETSMDDFLAAVRAHMAEMPGRTEASGSPRVRAYGVLTACRALHAVSERRQAPKPEAARWAMARHPEWADTIGWALDRVAHEAADPDDPLSVRAAGFVRFASQVLGVDTPELPAAERHYGDVELRASRIQGLGVFTTRAFRAGERVRRVNLVREITRDTPLREGERIEHCGYPDGKVVLWGLPDRHVNHSCDPNAWEQYDGDAVYIVARRDIAAGEEITFDYLLNTSGGSSWPCRCGAARCRGETVGDFFALPLEHQREYRPLLADWFVRRERERIAALDAALGGSPGRPTTLRPATAADAEFLFALLKEAMGRYVVETYGPWDEADQRARFFAADPTGSHQIVEHDGQPVGCLDVDSLPDQVRLNRVFLLPSHQGRGIGSQLIADVLARADAAGVPVRLRVLRVNPAQRLYERLGFQVRGETETHVWMEHPGSRP